MYGSCWRIVANIISIKLYKTIDREILQHDEVVFNSNGTVSAVPKHPLEWNAELSMGNKEDDMLMLPNIALLVRHSRYIAQFIAIIIHRKSLRSLSFPTAFI